MKYLFLRFPGGKSKSMTLSYDDDCFQDRKLVSILNRYHIKCTFNLNAALFADHKENGLAAEEINELFLSNGHEIAVHGAYHAAPGLIRAKDGIRDVLDCRLELERITQRIIRGMAYPDSGITRYQNGMTPDTVKGYLHDLGIVYARTLGKDNDSFELPTDWLEWMPTAHHTNPLLLTYLDKFLEIDCEKLYCAGRYPRLFYLWGHAFEFDRNNNWELLEQFCEKASNRSDIWYATNIEIYDYVTAFHSLVFSADNHLVYNPTLIDLYCDADGQPLCIKSGETKVL